MAIRTDLYSIDWTQSPRIINIDLSVTEADAQDLYDTCKFLEEQPEGMSEDQICDAGGWEPLGSGNYVGITVSLFNAQYKFADRPGPDWVNCNMSGGNVVGFTDASRSTYLYPRAPSAYVSADRTASSSATTKEQKAIEFASYNGGVTIDLTGHTGRSSAGVIHPTGTLQQPVDNLSDAGQILLNVGLDKVYVLDSVSLDNSYNWVDTSFIGESSIKTQITINPSANVLNCEFYDAHVMGTLDGNSQIERCVIDDLEFVDGYIFQCALGPGKITLGTNTIANIFSCYSTVPGTDTPEIDMNATGVLALRDYNGGILLSNYSGSGSHSIDLASGQVKLDATITSGTFVVRGVGKLVDTSGNPIESGTWNGGVTIVNELVNSLSLQGLTPDQLLLVQSIVDLLQADEERNVQLNKFYKRHKTTKQILLEKDYQKDVNNNETLTE